ncbi:ras association domain-containing protein 5 [Polymixia lowei]
MASASVVGQHLGPHRLDSEPQLLLFKLKKITLPRKSSHEKMMLRKSSATGQRVSATAEAAAGSAAPGKTSIRPVSPGPAGRTAATGGGMMPGEGRGALPADAPRSSDGDGKEGMDCGGGGGGPEKGTAAVTRESQTGQVGDCNSNVDCDSNRNAGGRRRTSLKKSLVNVMQSAPVASGHKGAHGNGQRCVSAGSSDGETGVPPLDRLTQGRTGVVRFARTEPHRREAWSIFPREEQDPRVKSERGEGHRFEPKTVSQDWCDVCSRQITAQALKCQNCSYTCHLECESQVQLDCNQRDRNPEETPSPRGHCSTAPQHKVFSGTTALPKSCRKCRPGAKRPAPNFSMTVKTVLTPSMTSSNSMSSGYCSLDEEGEDFTFFTAKTSFFGKHAAKRNDTKEEEERERAKTKILSQEDVRSRIAEYNAQVSENGMKLGSEGFYTGFIKVHLRLSRPVTVPTLEEAGSEGGSRQTDRQGRPQMASEGQEGTECGPNEKRTSFYLPRDCVKQLHISSATTSREVIQGLLKKFMVLDNPRKFALYRQTHRDGQDLFQKLPLNERPLLLRLIAGPDPEQLSFILKENETGEVEWHAFSVPELQNFLVILEKEEAERMRTVEQRYAVYRQKLQQALRQHDP